MRSISTRATVRLAAVALAAAGVGLSPPALAAADTTTPVVTSFVDSTPGPLRPGASVVVSYSASDSGSGVQSVVFHFTDPLGQDHQVTAQGPSAASGPATAVVDASWPSGSYRLDYVDATDAAANRVTYVAGGTTSLSPSRVSGPSGHTFDFDAAGFTVDNGPAVAKPAIRGLLDRQRLAPTAWQPVVNAYVVPVRWADLQPTQGGDIVAGNAIDAAIAQVRALSGTTHDTQPRVSLKLRVLAGDDAPDWAKNLDGPPVAVTDTSTGAVVTVGRFWTPGFAAAYQDLQAKLAARYDTVPEVRDVVISRCTLYTAEPFIRNAGDPFSVTNLLQAGFTTADDHRCQTEEVDAHAVWRTTAASLALNPYPQLNPDGTTKVDEAWTEQNMDYCRSVLGARCVLENNSVRDPITALGANYPSMYAHMRALGGPVAFQTAPFDKIGSLCNALGWTVAQGAWAVELPKGYAANTGVTTAGLAAYDGALERPPATPDTVPPGAPANPTAAWASGAVNVAWGAATDSGLGVGCYTVSRNGAVLGTTMATQLTDASPVPGVDNTYTVSAADAAGNAGPASSVTVPNPDTSPPSAPTGLAITAAGVTSLSLAWTASSDNVGVDHYTVFRDGAAVGTTTGTAFADTGLSPSRTYTYTATASDAAGNTSAASSAVSGTTAPDTAAPSVPSGVSAAALSPSRVALSWQPSTDDVGVAGYRVYRNGSLIGSSATTTFTDATAAPATSYAYTVSATDAAGNASAQSPSVTVRTPADTTAPSAPAGLRATSLTAGSVGLAWNASTDDVAVAGYRVYRNGTKIATTASPAYTDPTARKGKSYTYTVKAYDAAGNVSAASNSVSLRPV